MRHRFSLGWLGATLLSYWLVIGVLAAFSGVTAMQSPLVAAEDSELLDDELPPPEPAPGDGETTTDAPETEPPLDVAVTPGDEPPQEPAAEAPREPDENDAIAELLAAMQGDDDPDDDEPDPAGGPA